MNVFIFRPRGSTVQHKLEDVDMGPFKSGFVRVTGVT